MNIFSKLVDDGLLGHLVGHSGHVVAHAVIPCRILACLKVPGISIIVEIHGISLHLKKKDILKLYYLSYITISVCLLVVSFMWMGICLIYKG